MLTRASLVAAALSLAVGILVGVAVGHSAKSHASTVTVAGGVTTVHAADPPTRTVTHVVVHTHTVTQTITAPQAAAAPAPTEAPTIDCNNLPASASATLDQLRESRCEMEKLNAENPSAADEHLIETMISEERAIKASG